MTDTIDRAVRPGFGAPAAPAAAKLDWGKLMLGFGGMVIGQFMAILDIQIVSASLPQIQAGIGASADEVSWVQTAYLVAEVVMIPLSGYLSRLWGTQSVYLVSCVGFIVMSVLTGLSTSVDMMILTRALQGFIGGAMIPTVFAVAFTAFPPERRMTASIVMGLIVTLAPTIGPTLGGHLTDMLSWRWLFFINVFPGMLALFLVARYGKFDEGDPSLAKGFDWFGLIVMAIFLLSLQYVLEEGSKDNWFEDDSILLLTITALVGGAVFIWRSLSYRQPIVELRAFANKNFLIGVTMTFVTGASLFGGTFLLPLFLGRVRGYSSAEIGTTMLVSGLSMFLTGPTLGRIARKLDARIPMFIGFAMAAWGFWLGHAVTADWGFWEFAALQAWRGVGVMIAMTMTQTVTMATLPPQMVKNASGLINLARNTGGAVGLALLSTVLTNQTVLHQTELSNRVSLANPQSQAMLAGLTQRMMEMGVSDPAGAARKAFDGILVKNATVLAFGDGFSLLAVGCLIAAIASLFATPPKTAMAPPSDSH